jgi:hypothetical protein
VDGGGEGPVAGGSAPGARAGGIQPSGACDAELGLPVPLADIVGNIKHVELADHARRLQDNLDRRLADEALLKELAACQFAGVRYQRFELRPTERELEELVRDSDARGAQDAGWI